MGAKQQPVRGQPRPNSIKVLGMEQPSLHSMLASTLLFRNSGNKDTNYMLAILDSRMKIVAHERFQYVLLKKFGKFWGAYFGKYTTNLYSTTKKPFCKHISE